MRIGVDVGGTNTDAVLMDGPCVVAKCKTPTTSDISGAIVAAIRSVLTTSATATTAIRCVMIGTTQFSLGRTSTSDGGFASSRVIQPLRRRYRS